MHALVGFNLTEDVISYFEIAEFLGNGIENSFHLHTGSKYKHNMYNTKHLSVRKEGCPGV